MGPTTHRPLALARRDTGRFLSKLPPPPPPATGSTTLSTKEILEKLTHGDLVPIDLLSPFEEAIPMATFGSDDVLLDRVMGDHR